MKESWLVEYNDDKACFHFLPTGNSANSSVVDGGKLGLKTKQKHVSLAFMYH